MPARGLRDENGHGMFSADFHHLTYSEVYKEKLFLIWYQNGCVPMTALATLIPPDESNRTPTSLELGVWCRKLGWRERADTLNQEVKKQIERKAVEIRVEMLNRQAELGLMLQIKGREFFNEHPINHPSIALRAIIQGAELEKSARGIPEALMKISEMSDEKLSDTVQKLLSNVSMDELDDALKYDVESEFIEVKEEPEEENGNP